MIFAGLCISPCQLAIIDNPETFQGPFQSSGGLQKYTIIDIHVVRVTAKHMIDILVSRIIDDSFICNISYVLRDAHRF